MLTFVEEIVLLQLDDARGVAAELPSQASAIVLAGAALMELALRNQVDTDLKQLFLVDPAPTGDDILDDVLAHLAAISGELTAAAAPEPKVIVKRRSNISSRRVSCGSRMAASFGCSTAADTLSSTTATGGRSRRGCASSR